MAKKGKLLDALDRYKGVDHELERQKKLQKQAEKRKQAKRKEIAGGAVIEREKDGSGDGDQKMMNGYEDGAGNMENVEDDSKDESWETEDDEDGEDEDVDDSEEEVMYDISHLNDSLSSSEDEIETQPYQKNHLNGHPNKLRKPARMSQASQDIEMVDGDNNSDDIPLSDLDSLASEEKGDILPHQRLTINHVDALTRALETIAIPFSSLPFFEHQSITSSAPTTIPDIDDDLNRELAFYSQSLAAAQEARKRLLAEGVPFSRPADYFAEMVKSDEHMGQVKQKLVDAAASKKAAAEARKQRDLRKFGKQVQTAKLQERAKEKREMLDKINILKRKRKGLDPATEAEDDPFDVAIDNAARDNSKSSRARSDRRGGGFGGGGGEHRSGPNQKRQRKDQKYGFGGKKRHAKSGDAISSADMRSFPGRRMKYDDDGGGGGARGGRNRGGGGGGRGAARGGRRKPGGGGGGSIRPGKSKRAKAKL